MAIYGYVRVSDKEQHDDRQITNIKKYCNIPDENIFIDKVTGKTYDRPEYSIVKRIIKAGDELILSELDRIGRTKAGIKDELDFLKTKGVKVRALDIPTTLYDIEGQDWVMELISNILIEVYSALAQQELERKEMRQRQGIEAAKQRGVYKGRKPIDVDMTKFADIYKRWKAGQLKTIEARALSGLRNNTFYRTVEQYERKNNLGKFADETI